MTNTKIMTELDKYESEYYQELAAKRAEAELLFTQELQANQEKTKESEGDTA